MQHPIGSHALLADGRTAALVAADGDVVWLCWPRVDSAPFLLRILDDTRGGTFCVRPQVATATVAERGYVDAGLVLHTVWTTPTGQLTVTDALSWDPPQRLVRRLRARGGPVLVDVTFAPAFDWGHNPAALQVWGDDLLAEGPGMRLMVRGAAHWRLHSRGANATVQLEDGDEVAVILGEADAPVSSDLDATVAHWTAVSRGVSLAGLGDESLGVGVLGESVASALLRRSAALFTGLRQRGGGLVAAPTTSLPQWPGSSRTWDYRYTWLRDNALAVMAMLRLGMVDEAAAVGDFCGNIAASGDPVPMLRVDGTAPPDESTLDHLDGYQGARPVRCGNAAALQAQVDVLGEVIDMAWSLFRLDALPDSLRQAVPQLARASLLRWSEPDHGIWEPRIAPRHHTHSRVMAWTGLQRAAALADHGVVGGDSRAWRAAAQAIRTTVLEGAGRDDALQLHSGGGPDAALAMIPLVGFLPAGDRRVAATLDAIASSLGRPLLLDRYLPHADGMADPCAPFVFPTFWLAAALQHCGRDGSRHFAAASATRGELDLFGEVADPVTQGPLGNYPQVQSHAALVMAATRPRAINSGEASAAV